MPATVAAQPALTSSKEARYRELMERYLGADVLAALADDDVTEVYVNAGDGVLRADTHSKGKVALGATVRGDQVEQFLGVVAASRGDALGPTAPSVQAELPDETFHRARLQGFVPPLVPRACFVVRKPARRVFTLASYVEHGTMTEAQCDAVRAAVRDHENVLVCGGTGSGKTTLCNAVLLEMSEQYPQERVVVLEDTAELQCRADDHLALRTSPGTGAGDGVSLSDLVRFTLRCTPDRIVVGEVRDGAALHLLDAWATGHPGGCATVHATDAQGALRRLDRLAQRAGVPPQHELVAEAVGVVVVIRGGQPRPPRRGARPGLRLPRRGLRARTESDTGTPHRRAPVAPHTPPGTPGSTGGPTPPLTPQGSTHERSHSPDHRRRSDLARGRHRPFNGPTSPGSSHSPSSSRPRPRPPAARPCRGTARSRRSPTRSPATRSGSWP